MFAMTLLELLGQHEPINLGQQIGKTLKHHSQFTETNVLAVEK
jgi:hypothetical protein